MVHQTIMVIAISFGGLYSFSVPKGKGQSSHKNGLIRTQNCLTNLAVLCDKFGLQLTHLV